MFLTQQTAEEQCPVDFPRFTLPQAARMFASMPRHPPYNVNRPSARDADTFHEPTTPAPETPVYSASPQPRTKPAPEAESHPDAFHIAPGWIDTADRTRTWNLLDTNGGKVAEICTRRDAQKLADILNRVREANKGRSR